MLAIAAVAVAVLASCGKGNKDEAGGSACLAKARAALAAGDFAGARNEIDSLRTDWPLAFNAREEGILLLDSIEMANAKADLDSEASRIAAKAFDVDSLNFVKEEAAQKIKFYEKKLEHDKANFKKH